MPDYFAFGINIHSDIKLPELKGPRENAAVELSIVSLAPALPQVLSGDEPEIVANGGDVKASFPGVGVFTIHSHAGIIEVATEPGADELVRYPLLGPVMAIYLHLTARVVLHASAVTLGSSAVAFIGDKGAGKSTTAAAALAAGERILTDDLLVCTLDDTRGAVCEAGFGQLKLNQDAADILSPAGGDPISSPHPQFSKAIFRLDAADHAPRPLSAVCQLRRGPKMLLSRLGPAEALMMLMRYTYVQKYGPTFLKAELGAAHFRRCAGLVAGTRVFTLTIPEGLTALPRELMQLAERLALDAAS